MQLPFSHEWMELERARQYRKTREAEAKLHRLLVQGMGRKPRPNNTIAVLVRELLRRWLPVA